jgi:type IV secretory pathway VirJ component
MRREALALSLSMAMTLGAQQAVPELRDLPITEVPARGASAGTLAIFLSGDGGWAAIDRAIADGLAARGITVVGMDARAYLSTRRTPARSAADVARIARAYMRRPGTTRLVLAGYSRGATMVPFVATRLPPDVRSRVALLAMLGMETTTNFQFHWIDIVATVHRDDDLPVLPELERLRGTRMLCVYGAGEADSACRQADPTLLTRVARPGDHHFDGDYAGLAREIASALPATR